jgi:cell division septum initiation protein DivIVA
MVRWLVERKLTDVSSRIKKAERELEELDHQVAHFDDEADDMRIRAMVAETPVAAREHEESRRHAEVMRTARASLQQRIADLRRQQDELLDRLSSRAR